MPHMPREIYPQVHRDNKPNLPDFLFYINVIISYSFNQFTNKEQYCGWTDGRRHLIYIIATAIGWTIPEVADEYHVVWSLPSCFRWTRLCMIRWTILCCSSRIEGCPEAWNLSPCCFICLHNTVINMLCRLFDDHKDMDIYIYISLYLRNTAILENKKNVCIFSHQLVNTCNLHIHALQTAQNVSRFQLNMLLIGQFKKFLKFIKYQ